MKEELCDYELSVMLEEKGMGEECLDVMRESTRYVDGPKGPRLQFTLSLAQTWLREIHDIEVYVQVWMDRMDINNRWERSYYCLLEGPLIQNRRGFIRLCEIKENEEYVSYEQALAEGIEQALKLIEG